MHERGEDKSWKTSTRLPFDASNLKSWEWWLNKVGIALLLLGVAFLFKLSVERDWLSPLLRVGFGLALGAGLLALGLRLYTGRRSFAQVLLGGGVGVLYTTGFAAFELYGLAPYPIAFAFMVAVTLLAFSLSLRQDDPSLSVIGVLGGLGTPFVLYSGTGGLGGLVLYACLVLSGAGAIYLYKGWRSLLYSSFIGGWAVFLAGYLAGIAGMEAPAVDRVALQAGVLFAWLLFWLVPVTREVLHLGNPGRWPKPEPGQMLRESPIARAMIGEPGSDRAEAWTRGASHAHLLSVSAPLLALAFTRGVWSLPGETLGLVALGMSVLYTAAALVLLWGVEGRRERGLYYTQGLVALLLATVGLVLVLAELSVDALFFTVAAEAAVLHLVSRRLQDRLISVQAHILSALAIGWLFSRIFSGLAETAFGADPDYTPFLNSGAIVDLYVVALTFGAARVVLPEDLGPLYRLVAHAALFCWLSAELLSLPDGGDWTILVWALYAVALRLISRRSSVSENAEVYRIVAHGLAGLIGVWLLGRLFAEMTFLLLPGVDAAAFGFGDVVNLALITLAFGISPLVGATKTVYRIFGHAALLCWLSATLGALPDGGDLVFAAWTAYAAGLHLLSRRLPSWGTTIGSHALSAIVGLWLVLRLGAGTVEVLLGPSSGVGLPFLDLAVIVAAWSVSLLYPGSRAAYVYRLAATAAFSFWLMPELLAFQDGDAYLLIAWSVYAVALHLVSERLRDGSLSMAGHAQFFLAGIFLLGRLLFGLVEPASVGTPFVSVDAVADLSAILLAAVASLIVRPGILASIYRVAAHVALLAFAWRELSVLPGSAGDALVTVVWGLYAAGLLVWGLRRDRAGLIRGGFATLFLVVGKLFLVDLAGVEAIWRVLLFLGFGGLFLALSYYLRSLWRPGTKGKNGIAVPTMERKGGVS
ncbi:MAG: DUF2339 domain-containing protein [Actinomycetota bacterium]|nr:DUF2339 domain-containing protein [Actinomycetota bacterium]